MDNWNRGVIPLVVRKYAIILRYVDDIVLIASTYEEISELLERIKKASMENDLPWNRQNSRILIVDRNDKLPQLRPVQRHSEKLK